MDNGKPFPEFKNITYEIYNIFPKQKKLIVVFSVIYHNEEEQYRCAGYVPLIYGLPSPQAYYKYCDKYVESDERDIFSKSFYQAYEVDFNDEGLIKACCDVLYSDEFKPVILKNLTKELLNSQKIVKKEVRRSSFYTQLIDRVLDK